MTDALMTDARPSEGDLSRRVASRRAELGLSVEEVARKTGIDPGYLHYLEQHAEARLSGGSLVLLSMALKTTPQALLGGRERTRDTPYTSDPHPELDVLSAEQCDVHLGMGKYGLLVYGAGRGPVAVPVNYEYTGGQIVISTDPEKAAWLEGLRIVGFEVDRVDEGLSEGWSVLVTGEIRIVDDPNEVLQLSSLDLYSWGDRGPHVLVAITPTQVTGRVIVHHAPW
jgi:nitroimidazol reductase NimA-like FMN-containing flavoprotein (pyridoxamine 5'-phosphate oxidase superfamily)